MTQIKRVTVSPVITVAEGPPGKPDLIESHDPKGGQANICVISWHWTERSHPEFCLTFSAKSRQAKSSEALRIPGMA